MKAIEFIKKFGWEKAIEVLVGRKSWVDKKSGRLLSDNSYLLENTKYEHAIGSLYMGKFTEYDDNSYRNNEVNLLKLKKYTDAYELVQSYGGLVESKRAVELKSGLVNLEGWDSIERAIALVEEVENYDEKTKEGDPS